MYSSDGRKWLLERVPCPLCGSSSYRIVKKKKGNYIQRAFDIVECRQCKMVYVNPRVSAAQLPELYNDSYYRGEGFDKSIGFYHEPNPDYWLYRAGLHSLNDALGTVKDRNILDFGCGTGALVQLLRQNGANVTGVDTSSSAIAIGERTGANVRHSTLEEMRASNERYDAVVVMEVLEHVTNPIAFLKSVAELLQPNGVLYVTTGNWTLIRSTAYVMPEGHICYYTPETLARAFTTAGLIPVGAPNNHDWIGWRISDRLSAIPRPLSLGLARFVSRFLPRYGPFPLARRQISVEVISRI